jgi:hypothetical protein
MGEYLHHRKFRLDFAIILLIFSLVATNVAFTYWDSTTTNPDDPIIDIGVGAVLLVSQTVNPGEGITLVPVGAFRGINDVNEVIYTYHVSLNKQGLLRVSAKNILVDGLENPYGLIQIDIYEDEPNTTPQSIYEIAMNTLGEDDLSRVTIRVRLTLSMPENEEQYMAVKGRSITFTLEFKGEEPTR